MTPRTSPASTLRSPRHLELYLGAPLSALEAIAADLAAGVGVEVVTLRSKGKAREITCPTDETVRNVHRRILSMMTPVQMDLPDMVTGYVRGRSSVSNAQAHAGGAFLQKFDLRDFFHHISSDAVATGLRDVGFQAEVAALLAGLTTCRGLLPAGFSTSPAMANLACRALDEDIAALADSLGLIVTRYADDLTFSGAQFFDVRSDIGVMVKAHSHVLNEEKTRTLKRGQPMYVTGLSVSENDRPRLPRPFKRKLRQELHYISVFGLAEHADRHGVKVEGLRFRLGGQLAYASAVEPDLVKYFEAHFPAAYRDVARARSPISDDKRRTRLAQLAARVAARSDPLAEMYEPTVTIAAL
ncbi:Reverse transcriptase (RNA-dependent DNA polymerase) [Plantibacter flavus]|uniref:Reverse transcriptase (RNA-dependent DNA polymerase) n=1 Tax=Plantibacter flavus TaxID=150123 RepID=A0A3N2C765_9MICO|nr:reverse transcriptase family protein [Plantibacter flavus]ROR83250.1 reverse transcriptase (RNA-dependent DNA polymerase) [Plantibacter flavus]SMG21898.1 Reverse transcriptase (RNA-dependent DNA polymerase) [Plantibacter flavus]